MNLREMVFRHLRLPHEFHVFTDDAQGYPKGIIKRNLPHEGLRGWWNKIALFKPGVFDEGDRVLYFDLDTLIVGNIGDIAAYDGEHARLGQFFANVHPMYAGPQSGVMAWHGGFGAHIWSTFVTTKFPDLPGGDQKFLNHVAPKPDLWQDLFPGRFCSFKGEGGIVPRDVSVACFHGWPAVHQVFPNGWSDPQPTRVEDGMKLLGGFWWPQEDRECWTAMLASAEDHTRQALSYTPRRGVCVQAGGNVGVFPAHFARHFDEVHTFEPDARNFECMSLNLPQPNIRIYRSALNEDGNGGISLITNPLNAGQSRVDADRFGGIPARHIDGLELKACDLIYLDIEGFEKQALLGAVETIKRFRPTIVIEDNGLSEVYGTATGKTPKWLCDEFGYHVAAEFGRDVILTP